MIPLCLFVGSFALYVFTCGPYVVPYRDAGEMTSVLATLGVAHPPGYPLYTLLGRIALEVPVGSLFYRANLFSSLCAAGALVMLFLVLRNLLSTLPALLAVLVFGLTHPFWELSSVSEMYSLGILWFGMLLHAALVQRNMALWAFLMGLGLGARMDMLLLVPFFVAWFCWDAGHWRFPALKPVLWGGAMFGLGISVFLFLMVRSRTEPMLDWGNPDTLFGVFRSATRKSYSGTLDLLSLSYRSGENLFVNLRLYAQHVVYSFGVPGCVLALVGFVAALRARRALGIWMWGIFLTTGPFFLYLANMPPNPHSIAIVEASYLIPDVMMAMALGFALYAAFLWKRSAGFAAAAVVLVSAIFHFPSMWQRADKRNNFYGRDYVVNVLRSLPSNAVAVFHKDVQLFSLWATQLVESKRPDVSLVATGLSASPWYWQMKGRWNTAASPEISLKEPGGWRRMKSAIGERPLIMGYDVDMPETDLQLVPNGAVARLEDKQLPFDPMQLRLLSALTLDRGGAAYGETPDFFSTDLIGDNARAVHQTGVLALSKNIQEAVRYLRWAEREDPTFPRPSADLGYVSYSAGNFAQAYAYYMRALRKSEERLALATEYKSLPDVFDSCRREVATMLTQVGACAEKLGRLEEASKAYLRSLSLSENAQAHYNLAVTYWGRDWNLVISHMRRALELNPGMNEARVYLAKAEMLRGKK